MVFLFDDKDRVRGLGYFLPADNNVIIDLSSTVLSKFFPLLGPLDVNIKLSEILKYMKTTQCHTNASAFLKKKLLDSSFDLKSLNLEDKEYFSIAQDCANELILAPLNEQRSNLKDATIMSYPLLSL